MVSWPSLLPSKSLKCGASQPTNRKMKQSNNARVTTDRGSMEWRAINAHCFHHLAYSIRSTRQPNKHYIHQSIKPCIQCQTIWNLRWYPLHSAPPNIIYTLTLAIIIWHHTYCNVICPPFKSNEIRIAH